MLDLIRQSLAQFTPAERRIAEAILDTPSTAITWSITDAARIAKVSEPSIIRIDFSCSSVIWPGGGYATL